MAVVVDLTDKRFGLWTVICRDNRKASHAFWKCKCDCGAEAIVRGSSLRQGTSKSCGCNREENRLKVITKHGQYGTRLYMIWADMKTRVCNKNSISYKNYGLRGITICDEWKDFAPFYEWAMSNGYQDDLTIDRIDNDKGYSPDNCRWVDMITQQNNKSSNTYITYCNKTLTLAQWARELNVNYELLCKRVSRGWSFEKAINTPSQRKKVI